MNYILRLGTPYNEDHDAYCAKITSTNNQSSNYNSDLRFYTSVGNNASATERMSILSNGNVGIGTTSPGTMLQLEGAEAYVTLKNSTAENTDGGAETKIIFEDHSDTTLAQIQVSHDGTDDDTKGDFIISTHNGTSLTEALRIDSSQNVGIGTTSPGTMLHLHKQYTASGSYPAGEIKFSTVNSGGTNWDMASIESYVSANSGGTTAYPGGLAFKTKTADGNAATAIDTKMVLDAAGNVGIGTTNPGTMLQLEGADAYVTLKNSTDENTDGGAETKIIFEDHSDTTLAQIQVSHDGTDDDTKGDFIISTHNGTSLTEALRIDSLQNVGIGTTNPQGKLQLGGTTANVGGSDILSDIANGIVVIHPTPTSNTAINDPKTTLYLGRDGTSSESNPAGALFKICRSVNSGTSSKSRLDIDLRTNWNTQSNVMTLLDSGNVGIGTTDPSTSLHISSTDALILPVGTTAQQPTGANGMIRYNSTSSSFEGYSGSWGSIGGATTLNGLSDVLIEDNSLYIGHDPSGTTSTAQYNVAVGVTALDAITTGDNNTAVGYNALTANNTGENNTAIGFESLRDNTSGTDNTAIGRHALKSLNPSDPSTEGFGNVAIGKGTLPNLTTGTYNIAIGAEGIGSTLTTGSGNVIIGG